MEHVTVERIGRLWRGIDWGAPLEVIIRRQMPNGINRRLVWWPEHIRAEGAPPPRPTVRGMVSGGGRQPNKIAVLSLTGPEIDVSPHVPVDDRELVIDELLIYPQSLTQVAIRKLAHTIGIALSCSHRAVVQCCPNIGRGGLRHTMIIGPGEAELEVAHPLERKRPQDHGVLVRTKELRRLPDG